MPNAPGAVGPGICHGLDPVLARREPSRLA